MNNNVKNNKEIYLIGERKLQFIIFVYILEFLVQLDGVGTAKFEKVLIIGATNRPQVWMLLKFIYLIKNNKI